MAMLHHVQLIARLWLPLSLAAILALAGGQNAQAAQHSILVLGDSLTAGYGLPPDEGFVPQLQRALEAQGSKVELINAGVSGDTTAMGLARLDWALGANPDAVIVELGANDMLQGLPVATARANLAAILDKIRAAGLPVLLVGMKANRGLGPDYVAAYDSMFEELAKAAGADLYPFYLDGVAMDPKLNQADMLHPNADGVAVIVRRILPYVLRLAQKAGS
ncbi:MAG TPA: arylesterase [Devosiaceae bacterium]